VQDIADTDETREFVRVNFERNGVDIEDA